MKRISALVIAMVASGIPLANAQTASNWQAGDWQVKFGLHVVDPKSSNGSLAGGALKTDVGSGLSPTITAEYRVHTVIRHRVAGGTAVLARRQAQRHQGGDDQADTADTVGTMAHSDPFTF